MPKVPYLIPYSPSSHELEITEHFAGKIAFDPAAQQHRTSGAVIVCFSNRCGSNFLVSALCSSRRLRKVGEAFNAPAVIKQSKAHGFTTFQAYVESIAARAEETGKAPVIKLGWMQLFLLDRLGYLDAVFPDAHYVHIRREDLLGQAISFVIAHATKAWTSQRDDAGEVAFDYERIAKQVSGFAEANALFDRFFALSGRPVTRLTYETFLADPAAWIAAFGEKIGRRLRYVAERIELERQSDPRKKEFREKMLAMAAGRRQAG